MSEFKNIEYIFSRISSGTARSSLPDPDSIVFFIFEIKNRTCIRVLKSSLVYQILPLNSLTFIKKAVELNKPLEYFPYVGNQHGVRGRDTIHLYAKLTEFFLDNL